MKLLIADDEILTREGLLSGIHWADIGIDQVLLASDGQEALDIALLQHPDILLSDIRMPKIDGIELANRIQEDQPDTVIIFMSGYSDKEYLKAAIRLQAVSYVEKPLSLSEVRETVAEAVKRRTDALRTKQGVRLYSAEKAGRLSALFTRPYRDHDSEIQQLLSDLKLPPRPARCVTYILTCKEGAFAGEQLDSTLAGFSDFLTPRHGSHIHSRISSGRLTIHVLFEKYVSDIVLAETDRNLCQSFRALGTFSLCRGTYADSIGKLYNSYMTAALLTQSSFFHPACTLLAYSENDDREPAASPLQKDAHRLFYESLTTEDKTGCDRILQSLYSHFEKNTGLLPTSAKDIYYRFLSALQDAKGYFRMTYEEENALSLIETSFNLDELHAGLENAVRLFFEEVKQSAKEDKTIYLIKEYISANFHHESLSIKEMADHVYLSASYLCTYFKNQTGQTLNQYLTDYRMKKAMHLLADPRIPVSDISAKVGYSNGNYFGKSFKKYTGLSPSKYREKLTD